MRLPVMPPVEPMLAAPVAGIPPGRFYEPKWDGFRAIVFRDGDEVEIGSRNGRPMARYFPEVVAAVRESLPARCVVDGEIVVAGGGGEGLDFWALQQRLHPAASRVSLLSEQTPASLIAFDLLAQDDEDCMHGRSASGAPRWSVRWRRRRHRYISPRSRGTRRWPSGGSSCSRAPAWTG